MSRTPAPQSDPAQCIVPGTWSASRFNPKRRRARRNVATIHVNENGSTLTEILAVDGISWLRGTDKTIDLLYLDADGGPRGAKSIYYELLQAALHALRPGSLVLAHNSVNAARSMNDYLSYVRDPAHFRESVNVVIDDQGLEVSSL